MPVDDHEQGEGKAHIEKSESEFTDIFRRAVSQVRRGKKKVGKRDHDPETKDREDLEKGTSPQAVEEKTIDQEADDDHGVRKPGCGHSDEFEESQHRGDEKHPVENPSGAGQDQDHEEGNRDDTG
jgi:hypothetical protein